LALDEVDRGLGVTQRGWTWGIEVTCSTILFVYIKVGVHAIEKATEEVLSGDYPEHALDLALWTPPELIPLRQASPGGR
jgi:hypothetical protein